MHPSPSDKPTVFVVDDNQQLRDSLVALLEVLGFKIAAKLTITERAVEMRRSAIMRKLQVRSSAEVIDISTSHR